MKVIPKEELIELIDENVNKLVYEDDIVKLFKAYGDDYLYNKDRSDFELIADNKDRKKVLAGCQECSSMLTRKTWKEFRDTGLLWYINTIMQVFGWSLVLKLNDAGEIGICYPARTKFRGFTEDVVTKNTINLNEWMIKEGKILIEEAKS